MVEIVAITYFFFEAGARKLAATETVLGFSALGLRTSLLLFF